MKKTLLILAVSLVVTGLCVSFLGESQAASITNATDTMSKLKKSALSNHAVQFTTVSGIAAGQTLIVTFPSDFAPESGLDYTDVDVTDDSTQLDLAASPSGATWGVTFGGAGNRTFTLTSGTGTIAASSIIVIKIGTNAAYGVTGDKQMTNPTTAGSFTINISGTFGDSGSMAVAIANEDQVVVTGNVDPYLEFDVIDATVNLGALSRTAFQSDTASMKAATNSTNGYSISVNGPTLTNGSYTITAIGGVAQISNPSTEQFGFNISASGGAGTSVAPYDDTTTPKFAFDVSNIPDEVAKSTGVSDWTTYTMTYMANIANTTEPGTYTATHTYICTGNY